ncbi:MAG: hypothetical protein JST16_11625 [Bdellovibrionales bacterium]|nr:hypothetical protein [Bdellovibrionales bacterium]
MSDDPRKAKTLGEAALNADGKTYNGAKAIAWLSEVLHPGKGISEEEVRQIFERAKAKRSHKRPPFGAYRSGGVPGVDCPTCGHPGGAGERCAGA